MMEVDVVVRSLGDAYVNVPTSAHTHLGMGAIGGGGRVVTRCDRACVRVIRHVADDDVVHPESVIVLLIDAAIVDAIVDGDAAHGHRGPEVQAKPMVKGRVTPRIVFVIRAVAVVGSWKCGVPVDAVGAGDDPRRIVVLESKLGPRDLQLGGGRLPICALKAQLETFVLKTQQALKVSPFVGCLLSKGRGHDKKQRCAKSQLDRKKVGSAKCHCYIQV